MAHVANYADGLVPLPGGLVRSSDLLQEINRQFFHPRGLFLSVNRDGRLTLHTMVFSDLEGFLFEGFSEFEVARGRRVNSEWLKTLAVRHTRLGFEIQSLVEG